MSLFEILTNRAVTVRGFFARIFSVGYGYSQRNRITKLNSDYLPQSRVLEPLAIYPS